MKYEDGFEVLLHDQVDLGGGVTGTVVAVLDTGMYTPDYLEAVSYTHLTLPTNREV